MPSTNPQCYHTSASSIAAFKKCPQAFRLAYREGLRLDKDTDSQRMGTNWHGCHEVYANALTEAAAADSQTITDPKDWSDYALAQVVQHLDFQYEKVPSWKTAEEWELEKTILLISFVGYLWYWQNDQVEFLASELPFNLPLHMPRTGLPLSMEEVQRVGKIDHVIRWHGLIGALERKSTSRAIDSQSDYWEKSAKDTQVSMYAMAMRDMYGKGILPKEVELASLFKGAGTFGNTLYDVWHKPTIKPAMLSQKDTAEFCTSMEYYGEHFQNVITHTDGEGAIDLVEVDGVKCEIEVGKKAGTVAIRETVKMYSARLLHDIQERPEFYFARREIARTDADIKKFRGELYAIYQAQKAFSQHNLWYENESQCRATFACSYIPICYGPGAEKVCDGVTTPAGFKRIFVDLTISAKSEEE